MSLFDKGEESYKTDIKLGEEYKDTQTGVQGTATAVTFYQYGCERVNIEVLSKDGEIKEYGFDAPRLKAVKTGKTAVQQTTGGPRDAVARPGAVSR